MEQEYNKESGFKTIDIVLLAVNFFRDTNITFDSESGQKNVEVNVSVKVEERTIYVTEKMVFTQKFGDKIEVSADITMVGIFEKFGEAELDCDEFGRVNGAAIIYPYIREQLSNLTLKASIGGAVLLPPFNFTQKKPS